jgi:hypothetical protein
MLFIAWMMVIIAGETVLRLLGHTPNGGFGFF